MWTCLHCATENWDAASHCHRCNCWKDDMVSFPLEGEHSVMTAIREAVFSDLNNLKNAYLSAKDIESRFDFVHPEKLRASTDRVVIELSVVCSTIIEEIYREVEENVDSRRIKALQPPSETKDCLMEIYSYRMASVGSVVSNYESEFSKFLDVLKIEASSDSGETYQVFGRFLGELFMGQLGGWGGGMLGGLLSENLKKSRIKEGTEQLFQSFSRSVSEVNEILGEISLDSYDAIVCYGENLAARCRSKVVD